MVRNGLLNIIIELKLDNRTYSSDEECCGTHREQPNRGQRRTAMETERRRWTTSGAYEDKEGSRRVGGRRNIYETTEDVALISGANVRQPWHHAD